MVDLLIDSPPADAIRTHLSGHAVHVPGHFDAEVLSAIGRLERAGRLTGREASGHVDSLARSTFERHPVAPLLDGAWQMRANLRLVDALYVALARQLGVTVLSTDRALAAASDLVVAITAD